MTVQTGRWEQRSSIPDLTVARFNHASMTIGKQAYIACGRGYCGVLSSVEMLRIGAEAWELIEIPDLKPRVSPILC